MSNRGVTMMLPVKGEESLAELKNTSDNVTGSFQSLECLKTTNSEVSKF